jgi:hypothetical protein
MECPENILNCKIIHNLPSVQGNTNDADCWLKKRLLIYPII